MIQEEREKLVKKEQLKLNKIFKEALSEDDYKRAESLLENASFMRAAMTELREEIMIRGYVETYKNGNNQEGTKDSSYLRSYNNLLKSYNSTLKILLSMAPVAKAEVKDDGFDSF